MKYRRQALPLRLHPQPALRLHPAPRLLRARPRAPAPVLLRVRLILRVLHPQPALRLRRAHHPRLRRPLRRPVHLQPVLHPVRHQALQKERRLPVPAPRLLRARPRAPVPHLL